MGPGNAQYEYGNGWTPDRTRDSAIVALWPDHSTRAIGAIIGLSGQRVAQIAKRLYAEGLLSPRPSYWRTAPCATAAARPISAERAAWPNLPQIGSLWIPKSARRTRAKRVVAHQCNSDRFTVVTEMPDGSRRGYHETWHWRPFREQYRPSPPAHYAHPDGGESGTPSPVSQDVV